jgi:protein-arginine kinase
VTALRDSATRAELSRQVALLLAENDRLRSKSEVTDKIVQRWEDEAANRVKAQVRLNQAMRVLASLGRLSPRMAGLVAAARREIWGA